MNKSQKRKATDTPQKAMKAMAARSLSVAQKAEVIRLARTAALRQAETKSYYSNFVTGNQVSGIVTAYNLNYSIPQNVTSEGIIGEKVFVKNIRVHATLDGLSGANNSTKTVRIMMIRTKKALTNTSAAITATDVFRSGSINYACLGQVDLHKVDLLYDKVVDMVPQISGEPVRATVHFNVPVYKTHYVDADNSGYFKDKNYYIVMTGADYIFGASTTWSGSFSYAFNFKDE